MDIKNDKNTKFLKRPFNIQEFLTNCEIDDDPVYDNEKNINDAFKFINNFIIRKEKGVINDQA